MEPTKRSGPAKAAGAAKAASAKKVPGTSKASASANATGAAKKATGAAKKATKQTGSAGSGSSRRDLAGLIAEVRSALDELAQKGDTATKPGRDRVAEQVAKVEFGWARVKHELGLGRAEGDVAVENLRSALGKAEEAATHIIDAALRMIKKD
jgi:hypothetical protein